METTELVQDGIGAISDDVRWNSISAAVSIRKECRLCSNFDTRLHILCKIDI